MAKLVQVYRTPRNGERESRLLSFVCVDCGAHFNFEPEGITAAEANDRGHMMAPLPNPNRRDWYRWRCSACSAHK